MPLLVESEIIKQANQNKDLLLDFDTNQAVEESVNSKSEATQLGKTLASENVKTTRPYLVSLRVC